MAHRIGILGLGEMGERMLRRMKEHPAFAVVAAWDPAPEAAEALRRLQPAARWAGDDAALAGDPAIDCVYIATPPAHHLAAAHLAFDHGKAVFSEAPLAIDRDAARAAVERAERERHRAAVNFPFAAAPALRALASGLRSGQLGALERVEIEIGLTGWPLPGREAGRWLAGREQGGFVREVASHYVFLTQLLVGPLRLGQCRVDYPPDGRSAETAITASLDAGAVPVSLTGRVGGEVADRDRWVLTGANGAFALHDRYGLKRRINGTWLDIDFGEGAPLCQREYRAQLDALDAMLAGRPHALPSLREALGVQECVEAMLAQG
ncbi:MAG TPA: Gfo/Idh/MocA family oxidoreductase [Stellaceae bacterium]